MSSMNDHRSGCDIAFVSHKNKFLIRGCKKKSKQFLQFGSRTNLPDQIWRNDLKRCRRSFVLNKNMYIAADFGFKLLQLFSCCTYGYGFCILESQCRELSKWIVLLLSDDSQFRVAILFSKSCGNTSDHSEVPPPPLLKQKVKFGINWNWTELCEHLHTISQMYCVMCCNIHDCG